MAIFIWFAVLIVALYILVKGADYFVEGAKQMGAALGMSTFAIGVLIVGFGTSLPELASAVAAVLQGSTEIVVANAVGSNITNILFIVGLVAALTGRIVIERDLIKSELPIFFTSTVMFAAIIYDGMVDRLEALLLLGTFAAYLWYLFYEAPGQDKVSMLQTGRRPYLRRETIGLVIGGIIAVLVGAKYSIEAVIIIATHLAVPIEFVTITAIALGTSLPELFVSFRAAQNGNPELAIGNIFGSNAFNVLMVVGLPGIMAPLIVGDVVLKLGVPIFIAASAIFFVNGLARQVRRWEGMMMLLFFVFFIVKLIAFV